MYIYLRMFARHVRSFARIVVDVEQASVQAPRITCKIIANNRGRSSKVDYMLAVERRVRNAGKSGTGCRMQNVRYVVLWVRFARAAVAVVIAVRNIRSYVQERKFNWTRSLIVDLRIDNTRLFTGDICQ